MLHDIVEVLPLDGFRLHIRFDDGVEGNVDVSERVPFDGVFAPLRDPEYFRRVRVDAELGTIVWPNGADLDPLTLYSLLIGDPLSEEK
ncbi:MAG: DUF2442 domain-containing protein [Candidatus Eisenbacteria bacterium]